MRGMKGKLIKKLKSSKSIAYLKPNQILHASNFDNFVDNFNLKSTFVEKFPFKSHCPKSQCPPKPEKNDVVEVNAQNIDDDDDDKENVCVSVYEEDDVSFCAVDDILSEIDVSLFRRPDMESDTLFDPKLLEAFQMAVLQYIRRSSEKDKDAVVKPKCTFFQPDPVNSSFDQLDPLLEFEEKCPPGGSDAVIFYSTTLRGIRKTFEDCQSVRFLLQSFGVVFYERDVSVHVEFRDELWRVLGKKSLPPQLFVRGRYLGGADAVQTLNERGMLRPLFRDIPIDFRDAPCRVCCGLRFMLCYTCDGSRKVFDEAGGDGGGLWSKCSQCNENGLVVCPLC